MEKAFKFSEEKAKQCVETIQGTNEWKVARLGYVTGSRVGDLIGKGRAKEDKFTATGYKYIYEVAAERCLNDDFYGLAFEEYEQRVGVSSFAIRWGVFTESTAREEFAKRNGLVVKEVGLVLSDEVDCLADSPDGIVYDGFDAVGALEIKCPSPSTFMLYKSKVNSAEDLKKVEPKYYYQCLTHMICNKVDKCYFVAFDPMLNDGYHQIEIAIDEAVAEDIEIVKQRVSEAVEEITKLAGK